MRDSEPVSMGSADQQAELGVAQTQILFDLYADNRKDGPHSEAHRKGNGAHAKDSRLLCGADPGYRARRLSGCCFRTHVDPYTGRESG